LRFYRIAVMQSQWVRKLANAAWGFLRKMMTLTMMKRCTVAAVATLSMVSLAQAHAIWFTQRSGQTALIYGHGAEDLNLKPRANKIGDVAGFDAQARPVEISTEVTDYLYLVDVKAKPVVLTATMDNGLWSKAPDGKWSAKGKDEVPGAAESGYYLKYAIHLRAPLAAKPQVPAAPAASAAGQRVALPMLPNLDFQVLPQSDPAALHAGGALKLKVLYKGQAVAGAKVIADVVTDPDAKPLLTNRHGEVTVRIRNQGLNVVEVSYRSAPLDAAKANYTEHTGTLSFVLAHKPE
jgi:nickel transport protein